MIGQPLERKASMALALRAAVNKRHGRTDFVIVPQLSEVVRERSSVEDIGYFMSLESEYLRFEADRDTKAKHLVFVDSMVDRMVGMEERGIDIGLYFLPRLLSMAREPGHVFLYGPEYDAARSSFVARHRIPVQAWAGEGCMDEMVEAVLIGLRSCDGK